MLTSEDSRPLRDGQYVSSSTICLLGNDVLKLSVKSIFRVVKGKKCPDQLLMSVKSNTIPLLGQNHRR